MKKSAFVLGSLLALTSILGAQGDQDIAAKVLSVQGRVEVEQSPWAPASVDLVL